MTGPVVPGMDNHPGAMLVMGPSLPCLCERRHCSPLLHMARLQMALLHAPSLMGRALTSVPKCLQG